MSRRILTPLAALGLAFGVMAPGGVSAQAPQHAAPADSGDYVVVTLSGSPAAHDDATKTQGRFDPSSTGYAKALERMQRQHDRFAQQLAKVAPAAEIVQEYFITANAVALDLNGERLDAVAKISGVERTAESNLYTLDMDVSVDLINAPGFWESVGGSENAGAGVKVAVIDSGIDPTHPFFACKDVQFGGVYASGVGILPQVPAMPAIVGPGYEPAPGQPFYFSSSHGTHVAGTIAGCETTIDDEGVWYGTTLSGVAPGAELWDYNVFPFYGAGMVAYGGSAFSHDIAAAIEDAVADGMHVINMSLGGGVQGPNDFLAEASNAAVEAGVVVVSSAGNSGPDWYTVGPPGSASEVIGVAASTNSRGMGAKIITDDTTYLAVPGGFGNFDGSTYTIADWSGTDNEACSGAGAGDHTGEVVVIARGSCTFSTKAESAANAGAVGFIVYTYAGQDPIGMGTSGGPADDLPGVMVTYDAGTALEAAAPLSAVITGPTTVPTIPNLLAGFSSRGPAPFTHAVKPDITAPGVDILSSTVQFNFSGVTGHDWELYNGTSMASPHVAGMAAALLGEHDWSPAQVKSALVTTADHTAPGLSVFEQGGGLGDLVAADAASSWFYPANASFGITNGNRPANDSIDIEIMGGACEVSGTTGDYVGASTDGSTLTVEFNGGRDAGTGMYGGYVMLECDGGSYHIPWGKVVDR